MSSSYNALSAADVERHADYLGDQPSSADLAADAPKLKHSMAPHNPFGENSQNVADPSPKKDGSDNAPLKDGSKNPPRKIYGSGDAVKGAKPAFGGK